KLNEPARTPPKAEEDVARRNLVSPFARGAALAGRVRLSRARHASQVDGIGISRCLSAGASDRSCPRFEARRIASITIALARTLRRTGRAGHLEANRILAGRCDLLGFQATLNGTVDWQRDPRTAYRWPCEFYASLNLFELPDGIDVKYVWELNRH